MSVYLSGRSFTITERYRAHGNDTGAAVKSPVKLKTDKFGVATMRLDVQVRADLVDDFLPVEGDLDPFREQLLYDPGSLDIAYGEHQRAIITCEFQGILQSRINPVAQRRASVGERSVTLRNGSDVAITLTYMGPRAAYFYAAASDPGSPRFAGELVPGSLDFQIIATRGPNDEDLSGVVTLAQLTTYGYTHDYVTRTTTFDRSEEGGIWRCTEENEGLIIATSPV